MENKKTVEYLNNKIWYRFLKVFFIAVCLGALIFLNWETYITYGDPTFYILYPSAVSLGSRVIILVLMNLITLLIFEVIRRTFYYIVLGSLRPKK